MTAQREHLRECARWGHVAPRQAAARARELEQSPYASRAERARAAQLAQDLASGGPGELAQARCDFPVVALRGAPSWVRGGVVTVGSSLLPAGAERLSAGRTPLLRRLRALAPTVDGEPELWLAPGPTALEDVGLELDGSSALAALLLVREAALRGATLPPGLLVSAAVERRGAQLVTAAVGHARTKAEVAARERPGARLYVCCRDDVSGATAPLQRLAPGQPFRELVDRLVPMPPEREVALQAELARAERYFLVQSYAESAAAYRQVLGHVGEAPAPSDTKHVRELRFNAALKLGAVELHRGATAEASRLFRVAETAAGEVDPQRRCELWTWLAGQELDRFDVRGAREAVRTAERLWSRVVPRRSATRLDDAQSGWLAVLGAKRRLKLLEGDARGALATQRELRRWCPQAQLARFHCDEAECLRRLGRLDDADRSVRAGRAQLEQMLGVERQQTEAFLAYVAGQVALDRGGPLPAAEQLKRLAGPLPRDSAARWRLEQLALQVQHAQGEPRAAGTLIGLARAEKSALRRWLRALGLVRAASLRRRGDGELYAAAAALVQESLPLVQRHPALARHAQGFVRAVQAHRPPKDLGRQLLRLSAY